MSAKKKASGGPKAADTSFVEGSSDPKRRRLLVTGASVAGAVGGVAFVFPLLASMAPSARAKAAGAPVEADISKLAPGQMLTVEWRGKPVWIVNRTAEVLQNLAILPQRLISNRTTPPTTCVRENLSCLWLSACAPIWVVRPPTDQKSLQLILAAIGQAGFSALAMGRNSIWRAACIRAYQRQRI